MLETFVSLLSEETNQDNVPDSLKRKCQKPILAFGPYSEDVWGGVSIPRETYSQGPVPCLGEQGRAKIVVDVFPCGAHTIFHEWIR